MRFIRRQLADPRLNAEYLEEYQPGPKGGRRYSAGGYLRLPGVEPDALPWPPKASVSRAARSWLTPTRWRG